MLAFGLCLVAVKLSTVLDPEGRKHLREPHSLAVIALGVVVAVLAR